MRRGLGTGRVPDRVGVPRSARSVPARARVGTWPRSPRETTPATTLGHARRLRSREGYLFLTNSHGFFLGGPRTGRTTYPPPARGIPPLAEPATQTREKIRPTWPGAPSRPPRRPRWPASTRDRGATVAGTGAPPRTVTQGRARPRWEHRYGAGAGGRGSRAGRGASPLVPRPRVRDEAGGRGRCLDPDVPRQA